MAPSFSWAGVACAQAMRVYEFIILDICSQKDHKRLHASPERAVYEIRLGGFHLDAAKGLHEEVIKMQLTIRMPQEYNEKIEILAEKMGLKKSDIARLALKAFIEENLTDDGKAPYDFDKVKHLLGIAESGIKDLGQRHREHIFKVIRIR